MKANYVNHMRLNWRAVNISCQVCVCAYLLVAVVLCLSDSRAGGCVGMSTSSMRLHSFVFGTCEDN